MAAAGDPALVRRMSAAIQRILDLLIVNLTSKSKAYKSKVLPYLQIGCRGCCGSRFERPENRILAEHAH